VHIYKLMMLRMLTTTIVIVHTFAVSPPQFSALAGGVVLSATRIREIDFFLENQRDRIGNTAFT
jgi:hypothetical protein